MMNQETETICHRQTGMPEFVFVLENLTEPYLWMSYIGLRWSYDCMYINSLLLS